MAGFDQRDGTAPRSRPGHLRYGPPKSSGGQVASLRSLRSWSIWPRRAWDCATIRRTGLRSLVGCCLGFPLVTKIRARRLIARVSNERGLTMSYASIADPGPAVRVGVRTGGIA